jgi:hypothetical protein
MVNVGLTDVQSGLYHHPLHFIFHGCASQTGDNIENIYMRPKVEVCRSIHLPPNQARYRLLSPTMPHVNWPLLSQCPDLMSCSLDTRTPGRWIHFPDLPPQQRRTLPSLSIEDKPVRLEPEPVVSDPTQPRWFGRIRRPKDPRRHFPPAVFAGPQWSSALATRL